MSVRLVERNGALAQAVDAVLRTGLNQITDGSSARRQ